MDYIFVKCFGLDCFWFRSRILPILISVLVSENLSGLGLGLGLDYITACNRCPCSQSKFLFKETEESLTTKD